jgi:adenylate cyclase
MQGARACATGEPCALHLGAAVAQITPMNDRDIARIGAWLTARGLAGMPEIDLLREFCAQCCAAGLGLTRGLAFSDTLHPIYEGRGFRWKKDGAVDEALSDIVDYGRTTAGEAAASWQSTPFYRLLTSGDDELRRRLREGDNAEFPLLRELASEGNTDYVAFVHRFAHESRIGEIDGVYSHWATNQPDGFSDGDLAALRKLVPSLALAVKCGTLARIAETLVETYLGRDAGRRVLSGRIQRGVAEWINAAMWFSDLRGYTTITDSAAPQEIIPLLNDYAEAVISAVHDAGGDVLKLIGDAVLAVFNAEDTAEACRSALRAEAKLRERVTELNRRRAAEGRPVTTVYLGLHVGDAFYGNIGSAERLDFTVVGPAVNEVSRIASMCRSVDRPVLVSSDFAAATPEPERSALVSVGRYALRGVGRPQDLFTLDSAMASGAS